MKLTHRLFSLLIVSCSLLTSCAAPRSPYSNAVDLSRETWMSEVDKNPALWAMGADAWFLNGSPNATEMADRYAADSAEISTMKVRVPYFTDIRSNGDFAVQIFGTDGPMSLTIYGPNDAVRATLAIVRGNTLFLNQVKNAPPMMRRVIIRIGMPNLRSLTQLGCGLIEGINLHSPALFVNSLNSGNMYLGGHINLYRVNQSGNGAINIFNVYAPELDIKTTGIGPVNISGSLNVRTILHHGKSNVNLVGVNNNSCGIKINADGCGKIGLLGRSINLQEIRARENVRVYAYSVSANNLHVYTDNQARVGLAGAVNNLTVDTGRYSLFLGRSLCARIAYVRGYDASHMNVAAADKIFASANQRASIYFFGSPSVSRFTTGNGVIMPIWSAAAVCGTFPYSPYGIATVKTSNYKWVNRRLTQRAGEG